MAMETQPRLLEAHEGTTFLIHFAQIHETFRQAETESLAALNGIHLEWVFYDDSVRFAFHPPHVNWGRGEEVLMMLMVGGGGGCTQ